MGEERDQRAILRRLVELQYERNDFAFARNKFRVRGDTIEVFPAYEERAVRIQLFGDEVERIASVDPLTGEIVEELDTLVLFPASHYVTDDERLKQAIEGIEAELAERLAWLEEQQQAARGAAAAHAHHLRPRDAARGRGCSGIENYSLHLDGRQRHQPPYTLLDYFPDDCLVRARRVARRRSRSCTGSTRATARARTRSSSTASGCRRRWTTGRCGSRSSSRR